MVSNPNLADFSRARGHLDEDASGQISDLPQFCNLTQHDGINLECRGSITGRDILLDIHHSWCRAGRLGEPHRPRDISTPRSRLHSRSIWLFAPTQFHKAAGLTKPPNLITTWVPNLMHRSAGPMWYPVDQNGM